MTYQPPPLKKQYPPWLDPFGPSLIPWCSERDWTLRYDSLPYNRLRRSWRGLCWSTIRCGAGQCELIGQWSLRKKEGYRSRYRPLNGINGHCHIGEHCSLHSPLDPGHPVLSAWCHRILTEPLFIHLSIQISHEPQGRAKLVIEEKAKRLTHLGGQRLTGEWGLWQSAPVTDWAVGLNTRKGCSNPPMSSSLPSPAQHRRRKSTALLVPKDFLPADPLPFALPN